MKSLLCAIGLHRFSSITVDSIAEGVEGVFIYKHCQRCPKTKWIVKRVKNELYDAVRKASE